MASNLSFKKSLVNDTVAQKLTMAVALVFLLVSGLQISVKANEETEVVKSENYSVLGIVSNVSVSEKTISITKRDTGVELAFSLNGDEKIETNRYEQLILADIHTADTVILQGLKSDDVITIRRIINFSWNGIHAEASTSPGIVSDIASSTSEIASSTTETISDSISSTTAPVTMSTDNSSTTDELASTTDSIATSTDSTPPIVTETASSTEPVEPAPVAVPAVDNNQPSVDPVIPPPESTE